MTTLPNLDDLARLAREATQGRWHWWTANSLRELRTEVDRFRVYSVAYGHINDGAPDIAIGENDMSFIAAASPAVVMGLVRIAQAAKRLDDMLTDGGHGYMVSAESAEELHNALQGHKPSEATNE